MASRAGICARSLGRPAACLIRMRSRSDATGYNQAVTQVEARRILDEIRVSGGAGRLEDHVERKPVASRASRTSARRELLRSAVIGARTAVALMGMTTTRRSADAASFSPNGTRTDAAAIEDDAMRKALS